MCNDFGDAQNNLLGGGGSLLKKGEPKWDTEGPRTDTALNVCEVLKCQW